MHFTIPQLKVLNFSLIAQFNDSSINNIFRLYLAWRIKLQVVFVNEFLNWALISRAPSLPAGARVGVALYIIGTTPGNYPNIISINNKVTGERKWALSALACTTVTVQNIL